MKENKQKEIEVRTVFLKYSKAVHFSNLIKDGYGYFLESDDLGSLDALKQFKIRVESAMNVCRPITKLFLKNCYIKRGDEAWWQTIYSKSTFYRYKQEAIDEFLYYFNL